MLRIALGNHETGPGSSIRARLIAASAVAMLMSCLASTTAQAQGAARPARAGKLPAQVTVTNARDLILASLDILPTSGGTPVAQLKEPLGAGASIKLRLVKAKGCAYVVTGAFEDGSDLAPVQLDLCKDAVLRLVD